MGARRDSFNRALADYDEKAVKGVVDFDRHRYVSIERDPIGLETYVKGHRTLRAACDHLASAVRAVTLLPVNILDLDSDELIELDVFAHVAPKSMDAVAVMMPRQVAALAAANLDPTPENLPAIGMLTHAIEGTRHAQARTDA